MRPILRVVAVLFFVPSVVLFAVVATAHPTLSGLAYAAGFLVVVTSGLLRRPGVAVRTAAAGLVLLGGTVALRLASASGTDRVHMSAPGDASPRWVDRLLDEEDLSVNAARALVWTGFMRDPDVPGLAPVMRSAYVRMRAAEGATPSPVVATYAGFESPGREDTVEIGDVRESDGVVVFLHGFAGSFTLPCWVVSRAAAAAGFATVCPSTRWVGDWWSPEGESILRETVHALRHRGVRRIVLAGLSNGAIGASLLAPRLRGSFDGVILISGASGEAEPPGVPVLVLQGERDAQIPATLVHAYAARVGARYVSLDAGHFALLVCEAAATTRMTAFLRQRGGHRETARLP